MSRYYISTIPKEFNSSKKKTRCCLRCDKKFKAVAEYRLCYDCRRLLVTDNNGSYLYA